MEYFNGGSLADSLRKNGPLEAADAVALCIPIANALAAAHEHGILHRDLKPANILLRGAGEPVLSDFGIASITDGMEAGTISAAFTPGYAAPEVLLGENPGVPAGIMSVPPSTGTSPRAPPRASTTRDT
jgi:serine/threonine protein kinase